MLQPEITDPDKMRDERPWRERSPDDRQWSSALDECFWLLQQVTQLSPLARSRSSSDVFGWPKASPGFGERGRLRSVRDGDDEGPPPQGDITGETAIRLADAHFRGDEIMQHRRRMEIAFEYARGQLQRAVSEARACKPEHIPEPVREICACCNDSKWVVTERGTKPKQWRSERGMCRRCADRQDNQAAAREKSA